MTRALRTVVLSDFHVPPTEAERPKSRALTIDVRLSLPKLADGSATTATVAPVFRHIRVEGTGSTRCAGCGCVLAGMMTVRPKVPSARSRVGSGPLSRSSARTKLSRGAR